MHCSVRIKFWLYAHYWWLIIAAIFVAVPFLLHFKEQISTAVTFAGALLSIAYFLQKQKLDELRLFRDLFKEFNARYDDMNEDLARIAALPTAHLDEEARAKLVDYFNLCGEEYLYFRLGFIEPSVWSAWHNGMKVLIACPAISSVWESERQTSSYYDLPL